MRLRGAGYRYPGGVQAVRDVDLDLAGGLTLVTGPTGCGKSTLLRLAAGLVQRHGQGVRTGRVTVDGVDPGDLSPSARVGHIAFVGQVPGDQLVAGTVADEVAFGPESAGWDTATIAARVSEVLDLVGLEVPPDRSPRALSGGQQQRLVVGAALAAGARTLLLDEPLSQLDPAGAAELVALLRRLADQGVTVVVVEHRLEAVLPVADRRVLLAGGRVVPDEGVETLLALGLAVPGLEALDHALAARGWTRDAPFRAPPAEAVETGAVQVEGELAWTWPDGTRALHPLALQVRQGERIAVLGENGAGKSTLLGLLAGHLQRRGGNVQRRGRVVDVPQDPDLALFCPTVRAELAHGPRERGGGLGVHTVARALSLDGLLDRPPQALSRGQRLRTAVAAALACDPAVLLLDEPTSGQDHQQVERMMAALRGRTVVFATHDVDLALRHATRILVLQRGRLVADGPPAAVAPSLHLPPLARFCIERGLPSMTAAQLVASLEGA